MTTPLRARLTLLALSICCCGVAWNALYLQEGGKRAEQGPTTAVSIAQAFPQASSPSISSQNLPQPQQEATPQNRAGRLKAAIFRELARKGYGPANFDVIAPAILVYEFDSGRPLTGEPSEGLLKQLLFDGNPAPRGAFSDRAERDPKLMLEVQRTLLGLGFFSGTLSGHMDSWMQKALTEYQSHRGLLPDGRLNEATLLDLIGFSGTPLRKTAGN